MGFSFRPAVRENVGLLLGFIGESGSGKTMTALRVAKGMSGDKRFAVIDTENRRALHYADFFAFDHADMQPPFTPERYREAIAAADEAGYPVIVVDSVSHEHAGEGGLLDWHEAELQRMAGDDWKRRDACNMAAWIKPKMSHKQMVQSMLRSKAHLILCFRAEPKIRMVKEMVDGKEKTVIVDAGFVPVTEKTLPFELTASFLLTSEHPGFPLNPLKLQKQHRAIFLKQNADNQLLPIDEDCGRQIAAWASGAPRKPEPAKATL